MEIGVTAENCGVTIFIIGINGYQMKYMGVSETPMERFTEPQVTERTGIQYLFEILLAKADYAAVYLVLDRDMVGNFTAYCLFRDIRAAYRPVPIFRIHPPRAGLQTVWKERLLNPTVCDEETMFEGSKQFAWVSSQNKKNLCSASKIIFDVGDVNTEIIVNTETHLGFYLIFEITFLAHGDFDF